MFNKLKQGLAALTLAAGINCGDEVNNNFYGPNGEEISSGCDDFEDKYLWAIGHSSSGTTKKIGSDCDFAFEDERYPDFSLKGIISGNRIDVYNYNGDDRGVTAPFSFYLLKKGEFTREDVTTSAAPEYVESSINRFMCYFIKDDNLRALKWKGVIKTGVGSVYKIEDHPFSGHTAARRERDASAWYNQCENAN